MPSESTRWARESRDTAMNEYPKRALRWMALRGMVLDGALGLLLLQALCGLGQGYSSLSPVPPPLK